MFSHATDMMTLARTGPTRPAILVVEDSDALRVSLVDWLQFHFPDCRVHATESGEAALEEVRRLCPDVVLMDIDLPGIDGIEATRSIKSRLPSTVVVMLTMHDTPHHRLAAARAGAVAFVPKHEIDQRLHLVIERLLRARDSGSNPG